MDIYEESMMLHKQLRGKIRVNPKIDLHDQHELALVYSPGVAAPCKAIEANPQLAYDYTIKGNTIAIVTDGSAVLGLGNIGALASIPVMEGKAMLFKRFAALDAFPICLDTQDPDEIIATVRRIAPVFGGINLEDIAAPQSFYIEEQLQDFGDTRIPRRSARHCHRHARRTDQRRQIGQQTLLRAQSRHQWRRGSRYCHCPHAQMRG